MEHSRESEASGQKSSAYGIASEGSAAELRVEAELKATLLTELDAQRTQLRGSLADLRARARGTDGTGETQLIEQQLLELDGLRQQVVLAGSLQALNTLQHRLSETAQRGVDTARQGNDRATSGQWFMANTEYQRRSAELTREAHAAMAQNDRLFGEGTDVARRYDVDLSHFEEERAKLKKERDEAEQRGDHLHARMADALIARTTTNALTETLPHITDPAERARQLVRIERAREQEEAARKRLERQAEMDGCKQATERGLSPDDAKAHVESVKQEAMQKLEAGQDKQVKPRSASRPLVALEHEAATSPDSELTGKLSPAAATRVREAAAAITGSQPTATRDGEAKAPGTTPKVEGRNAEVRTV